MSRQHHEDTLRNLGHSDPSLRNPTTNPTAQQQLYQGHQQDDEIAAMDRLVNLLKPFDDAARKRMIRYAIDRLKNVATEEEPS